MEGDVYMNLSQYTIDKESTLFDALVTINYLGTNEALTLFLEDERGRICGTLTDGDARRSLINGQDLSSKVEDVANANFLYLTEGSHDMSVIQRARVKGIELLPILDIEKKLVDVVNLRKYKSFIPVDAVIMAGGKGERLRPLTEKIPKPLLPMNGKPIIDYIVEHIMSYGIKNISVTVNYLKEQLEEHFENPFNGIKVNTIREPKCLGTIGGLKYVEKFGNDTVLLMNSDVLTDINLEDFYLHFKDNDADMSVAAVPYSVPVPYGIFDLEGRDIKGIQEKPTYNYFANAGIYLFKRKLLDLIPEDIFYNATDFLVLILKEGYSVIRFPLNGLWVDIGNPQEYKIAQDIVKHFSW